MGATIRVGIIGTGVAGSAHAAAFSRLPDVQVSALWNRTRAKAEELAGNLNLPGLQVYDSWEALIEAGTVDAVSIATTVSLRREPIIAALEQGMHVLVEKQLTRTLDDAQVVAELARQAKTIAAVSLNWRYAPGNLVARQQIQEGAIGHLIDIRQEWRFRFPRITPAILTGILERMPYVTRTGGGGTLIEMGSHEFDRARFITGSEFIRVAGRLEPILLPDRPAESEPVDQGYALVTELSGGVTGTHHAILQPAQPVWETVLCGDAGTLIVTNAMITRQRFEEAVPVELDIPEPDRVPPGVEMLQHTWNRLIADFVSAIRQGDGAHTAVPDLPTFEDGVQNQKMFAAVEQAHTEQRWVTLAEVA